MLPVHFHKTLTAMRHHMEDELAAFKLDKGRSPEDLLSFRTNLEQFSKKKVPSIAKPVKRAMACFGREYKEGFGENFIVIYASFYQFQAIPFNQFIFRF